MVDRIRVTFYLPVTREQDVAAYLRVKDHIRSLRPRPGLPSSEPVITGYTVSLDDPAVFSGLWWSEQRHDWEPDESVLLIVDFPPNEYDRAKILKLKQDILNIYAQEDAVQEVLYVTHEEVSLL